MKHLLATAFVILFCTAALRADVTITMVTSVQGGMTAMAGGNTPTPTMTTRIKGRKARVDVDVMGQTITSLADLAAKQVLMLHADTKTAQVIATSDGSIPLPKVGATFTPTGNSKTIDGISCDEFTFTMTMSMAEMAGNSQMPPQAAEMMKDLQMAMNGSVWMTKTAPGAAEYVAFHKAAIEANLGAILTGGMSSLPSMEKAMQTFRGGEGIPYLTEMTMTVDGTGQIAEMMRQAGPMTVTTKVSKISIETIADDVLTLPADYKVVK
jgi:hypothetical protein